MMTTQDFDVLAQHIGRALSRIDQTDSAEVRGFNKALDAVTDACGERNQKFDRASFIKAVNKMAGD